MKYRARKSYGSLGGLGGRSGYLKPRDHMEAYRRFSPPETEYERKVKDSVRRSELAGPSPLSQNRSSYKTNIDQIKNESSMSRSEVEHLIDGAINGALVEMKRRSGSGEIPDDKYQAVKEEAEAVGKRIEKARENDNEVTVVDFVNDILQEKFDREKTQHLSGLNELRQDLVNEKWNEADSVSSMEDLEKISSEVGKINDGFFKYVDWLEEQKENPNEQTPSFDDVEQRFGIIKHGFEDLEGQKRDLRDQMDNDIAELELLDNRVGEMRREIDLPDFTKVYDQEYKKRVDYDSEVEGY
ncbi:MAG: hypothetical protein EPO62_05260 [Candidatus Nitrosotenuis sp.]|nr:MAG: hypothetical protein EPO62_05260 [Candidatus Nitrosotenuis sp.]